MERRIADIAIIGAGIAGATLAAALGTAAKILILEAEDQPGYHSTGRSAAFWSESYGGPLIQPITTPSFDFLSPFLRERGCLHIADATGDEALDDLAAAFAGRAPTLTPIDCNELHARIPGLRGTFRRGLEEASCHDIDVAAYHADALATARRQGAAIVTGAAVTAAVREGARWRLDTHAGPVEADIIVDAAGAWASQIADMAGAMPIPVRPHRRTVIQLLTDPAAPANLPLIMDAAGRFYFKPEAGGRLWLSPHDETPVEAQDIQPDEWDIAVALDRFERTMTWKILRRERVWAGLRSFSPDRVPLYGFDSRAPGFFWFAGQGGFGIQTAPAAAAIGAARLLDRSLPGWLAGVDADRYLPTRFS